MKIKANRSLIYGADNIDEGQIVDLPEGVARMWIEHGYGVEWGYETKPHPVFPMQAGGRAKPQSSQPPARRSRKRKSKPAEGGD
jgi:hypothetical protein